MSSALLELEQVRCSVDDRLLLDNVSLRTTSNRVGLSGKTQGISALMLGGAQLDSGELKILGRPLEFARSERLFGCAFRPNGVPAKWPVRRILELAAQVAGYSQRDAVRRATSVAERIGEPSILKKVWSRSDPLEQALATLALGLLTESPVLFVRLPLGELQAQAGARYGAALSRAVDGISVIAELTRPAVLQHEVEWVAELEQVCYVFEAGQTGDSVPLQPHKTRYLLRVSGDAEPIASAMQSAGLSASAIRAPSDLQSSRSAFLVDVHCDSNAIADTGPLLDLCVQLELDVLELLPIASLPSVYDT
jgi:predicted ABC-type transport system involved in lysophospholipase L1 biosynthesis ATPase subunit